jgi:hypothetical protein
MSNPEEIQRDIERTRASLSADVDRLNEKVAPSKVVGRRVDHLKRTATSVKDRVMGSAGESSGLHGAGDSVSSGTASAKHAVGSAASSVGDAASAAPQTVRRQTQGNPLAAGLVAFGIGWLLSSLPPASERERNVAEIVEDKAGELAEPVKETARDVAGNLQEPVQHSAEQVKAAATDAAAATADEAKSAVADVKQPLQQ